MKKTPSSQSQDLRIAKLRQRLAEYLQRQRLRTTAQRQAVTDAFFEATDHLSIEELLTQARLKDSRIGYATVYRTLKLLVEADLARHFQFGDGVTRYEPALENEHHDHIICADCGVILEFENERIERLQREIAKQEGFILQHHKLELYGHCVRINCPRKPATPPKQNLALGVIRSASAFSHK